MRRRRDEVPLDMVLIGRWLCGDALLCQNHDPDGTDYAGHLWTVFANSVENATRAADTWGGRHEPMAAALSAMAQGIDEGLEIFHEAGFR